MGRHSAAVVYIALSIDIAHVMAINGIFLSLIEDYERESGWVYFLHDEYMDDNYGYGCLQPLLLLAITPAGIMREIVIFILPSFELESARGSWL
ncbi:hypothetical protein B0T17DRAFT_530924 [Bombardia bombarda]|uniref:Uncharacterized protein n=1 Tax=Bombardia bombarda TaxID=252184 RepID=A0AA39WZZ3_9PEZI|nr:hypothetical protein B0T17DRAFT_530924 [Bombardia bombarda]